MAEPEFGRKPLAIQRILSENVGSCRVKSQSRVTVEGKSDYQDKENGEDQDQDEEAQETDWCPEAAAMSSTMAVSTLSTPRFFSMSTSNMSSINFSDPSFSEICQEKHFKTPNRNLERIEPDISPKETETTPRTPRTGWISDRTPSSGSGKTGSQRTPSRLMHYTNYRTPSGNKLKTPSSGSSTSAGSGVKKTPSSGSSSTRWNPFDSANSSEQMLNPTMSPNVFSIVISPSQEDDSSSGRFWSIDQQAEMFPAEISEESPLKQSIHIKNHNPECEDRTQEQIDLYFAERHDVTSPPDLPLTAGLQHCSQDCLDTSYLQQGGARSVTTQTILSLPPVLPPHVEAVLRQFYSQQEEEAGPNALSNSTLRRKLFNADCGSSEDESSRSPSPDSEPEDVPDVAITPGKLLTTPLTSRKLGYDTATWSSSPVRTGVRKNSFSPPDQMASPMFSPIVKERISARRLDRSGEDMDEDKVNTTSGDGELYQTAELGLQEDSPGASMDIDPAQSQSQGPALIDNWTISLPAEDDTEAGSKADTGYGTHTASITNLTPCSPSSSSSRQDSGVSSAITQETSSHVQPHVLMSYHGGDNSSDISVGFPLGSSTPTRK